MGANLPLIDMPRERASIVRFAEPVDEPQVTMLLLLGHAENSIWKFDVPKSQFVIRRMLYTPWLSPNDPGLRGCFGVIGPKGGILEAVCMVGIGQHWSSTAPYLEEYIVYVHPDYRSTGHAVALIDWLKDRVDENRIPLITGIMSQERTEAKCRLYRRHFTKVGEFFVHMPDNMRWESDVVMTDLLKRH